MFPAWHSLVLIGNAALQSFTVYAQKYQGVNDRINGPKLPSERKPKSSMATSDILYLAIVTFRDIVVKKKFPLLSLGWCPLHVVRGNRYLPRGNSGNTLSGTITGNVSIAIKVITLTTIIFLDSLNSVRFV